MPGGIIKLPDTKLRNLKPRKVNVRDGLYAAVTPAGSISFAERGLDISYETVRRWSLKFGGPIAPNLRRMRSTPSDYWHLDEMVIVMPNKVRWEPMAFKGNRLHPGRLSQMSVRSSTLM
jgi:hypothetical protein